LPPTGIQENVGEGEVDTIAVDVGPTGGKIYGPGDREALRLVSHRLSVQVSEANYA